MLPQPIIEMVTASFEAAAGAVAAAAAAGAAVASPLAGVAGLLPQAANKLRPAAPMPSWPARRRNPRRESCARVGIFEVSFVDICVLSFEVGRRQRQHAGSSDDWVRVVAIAASSH